MENDTRLKLESELAKLKEELAERNASIPIHSIRAHQLIKIEELEDKIAEIEAQLES